jgi:hypothetical protein
MNRAIVRMLGVLACAALTASAGTTVSKAHAHRTQWPAENLSGQIDIVDPAHNLVIMKDPSGTTFDFVVTHGTRIMQNGEKLKLADLASKTNQPITVHFIPERKGDIAATIKLSQ